MIGEIFFQSQLSSQPKHNQISMRNKVIMNNATYLMPKDNEIVNNLNNPC